MRHALLLDDRDNVANAIDDIKKGEAFSFSASGRAHSLQAAEDIAFGFKVAVKPIGKSEKVLKYGCVIGTASVDIHPGECVHIHNVEGSRGCGHKEAK